MKKILIAGLSAALVAAVVVYFGLERMVNLPLADKDAPAVVFTVPKGGTAKTLGPLLEREQLIKDTRVWRYHILRRGGLRLKAGRFAVSPGMTVREIATALEGVPLPEDEPVAIVEGWRLRDTDAMLSTRNWIEAQQYINAAKDTSRFKAPFTLPTTSLEGYLYPETYRVSTKPLDIDALIQRQLDAFTERFYKPNRDEIEASGRTLNELVIMASLLEREEPDPEQRPIVAGILWKRIDRKFPLGVDATSRYELPEWNNRTAFLKKLRDPNDIWNSRFKPGLPPGPIGAPAIESLLAALRPTKNEYMYYLHDAQKRLHPSRNAAEHEALRAKYNVY